MIPADGGGRDGRFRPSDVDWQRALYIPLTILAWLAVAVIVGWLFSHVVKTVMTLVVSGIIAFALTPLVSRFSRVMPRLLAIALAYVVGFAVVLGLLSFVVVTAAGQVQMLIQHLPEYLRSLRGQEPRLLTVLGQFHISKVQFQASLNKLQADLTSAGTRIAADSLSIVTGVLGTLVDIILVLILSIYLTANGPRIAARLRRETPTGQRRRTDLLIRIINQVVGGYVRGTLSLATLIGVLVAAGMAALQVPYAVLLGVLAFFMEFIPVLGVLVSGAICVAVALIPPGGWLKALVVLGYFVIVHVIEGDVVGPRIMGRAIGIHPATALVALVAGTELFGIWGALLAAPLAGLVQAITVATWLELRGGAPEAVLVAAKNAEEKEAHQEVQKVEREQKSSVPMEPDRE